MSEILERPLVLENPSSYVEFAASTLTEWEFLARLAEEADCGLLLDVNNVYVELLQPRLRSPRPTSTRIPADRVVQYHVAGHTNKGTHILDTHCDHALPEVWELYRRAWARTGPTATLYEWDENIPEFDVVHAEAKKALAHRGVTPRGRRDRRRVAARLAMSSPALRWTACSAGCRRWSCTRARSRRPWPAPRPPAPRSPPSGLADVILPSPTLTPRGAARDLPRRCTRCAWARRWPATTRPSSTSWATRASASCVQDYVQAHPSRSYTLNRLGDHLPEFVKAAPGPEAPRLLPRPRAARARGQPRCSTRRRRRGSPTQQVAAVPPRPGSGRVLVPIAAFRLLALRYPVNAYLESVQGRRPRPPDAPAQGRLGRGLPPRLRGLPLGPVEAGLRPAARSRGGQEAGGGHPRGAAAGRASPPARTSSSAGSASGWRRGCSPRSHRLPASPGQTVEARGWWARKDSNLRLAGYEPAVLTAELRAHR